ncbi:MAG: FAD/NAD(P)-binding protein [Caldilineaceae bacterium]
MFDWLIIGGGIHGTHITHVLTATGAVDPARIRVLDPAGAPLARWTRLTRNTGMEFMRSPSVHHLGVETDELNQFAQSPSGFAYCEFRQPYGRPAYDLFQAHNRHLVQQHKLAGLWLPGTATRLIKRQSSWVVESDQGALHAHNVLLALGRTVLNWPTWSQAVRGDPDTPVHHLFEETFATASVPPWQHLVVIGGGISAAQTACLLSQRAAREGFGGRVTLLMRHPVRNSHFDSEPCWNGPKCLTKFHHTTDYAQRRAQITAGRYRGSIPHDVMRAVERHWTAEQLHLCQDEVVAAQLLPPQPDAPRSIHLQLASGATIDADRVILATGFAQTRPGGELVDKAIAAHGLRCAPCGYPIVSPQLAWLDGLHVTGPLAELELGATAPNIRGARMAAERLRAVGV